MNKVKPGDTPSADGTKALYEPSLNTSSLPQISSIDARVKELENRVVSLTAALRLHDDYMSAQYRDGPDCGSLHPKAAANWKRIRSALSQGSPGQ